MDTNNAMPIGQKPFAPESNMNRSVICRVITESWPKTELHEIDGVNEVKDFNNKCFDKLRDEFDRILSRCHPASWILEAYQQLTLWTIVYKSDEVDMSNQVTGPTHLAPLGRYGWRYVAEKAVERLSGRFSYERLQPNGKDLSDMFTVIAGMLATSENSNFLHCLNSVLKSTYMTFSPFMMETGFSFRSIDDKKKFNQITDYINSDGQIHEPDPINADNEELLSRINDFLKKHFKFNLEEARIIIDCIVKICIGISAHVLVQPLDEAVQYIMIMSGLPLQTVEGFVFFVSLDSKHPFYESRDFLRKSQSIRMLNYCGVIIDLSDKHETIYRTVSANHKSISNSLQHLIISPAALAEWLDILIHKIAGGQREDLKKVKSLSQDMKDIEEFYNKGVFEQETRKLCEYYGYSCLANVKRYNKRDLPCGEIDLIAYNKLTNKLLIIECKNLAPTIDARGVGQLMSDHFKQKKYHDKFMKKIKWVQSNTLAVSDLFRSQSGIEFSLDCVSHSMFVTHYPNIVKFFAEEYSVMTYFELRTWLNSHD